MEAVTSALCAVVEPLYGLSCLRTSLGKFLETHNTNAEDTKKSYGMGLRSFGALFKRLPAEVLEEEIPRAKEFLRGALNDQTQPDLRLAAVTALTAANSILQDETRIFAMVGGLNRAQMQLLTYYFNRTAVPTSGL